MRFKGLRLSVLLLVVCISLFLIFSASSVFGSGNTWFDSYLQVEGQYGDYYYSQTDSQPLAFSESSVLQSYLNVYNYTRNTNWLDKIVTHVDTIIDNAHDLDGDGYLGWYYEDSIISRHFHECLCFTPVAEFILLVYDNPYLHDDYMTKADEYKTFIEDELIAKFHDYNSSVGDCYEVVSDTEAYYSYEGNDDTRPHGYNRTFAMIQIQKIMYDITGNETYKNRITKVVNWFKNNHLKENTGNSYKWHYSPTYSRYEDTSHGQYDINGIVHMFRRGLRLFTGSDMDKFTNTLTEIMWNQSYTDPRLSDLVDGNEWDNRDYHYYWKYWIELTQFDKTVWKAAANKWDDWTEGYGLRMVCLSELINWDPERIANSGFEYESSSDSTLPARWVRSGSSSSTAYIDTDNEFMDWAGLTLKSDGTSNQRIYQKWEEWSANTTYYVTFDGKTDDSGAGGQVYVRNVTQSSTLATQNFSNTAWQNHSFSFTSPSNTSDEVRIYLGHQDYTVNNGYTYFDNLRIKLGNDPTPCPVTYASPSPTPDYTPTPTPSPDTLTPTPTASPVPTATTDPSAWYSDSGYTEVHSLGSGNTGTRTVEFDVVPLYDNINGIIGYADYSVTIDEFSDMAMLISLEDTGYFSVKNGSSYEYDSIVEYCSDVTYSIKMVTDLSGNSYDVYVTPTGGVETLIADDYSFNSDAPATDDLGKVCLVSSGGDNQFLVKNHTVASVTSTPTPTASPTPDGLPYSEDFNDGTADNWTVKSGSWSVSNGVYSQSTASERRGAYYSNGSTWDDYIYSADIEVEDVIAGLAYRITDSMNDYYVFRFVYPSSFNVGKVVDGDWTLLYNCTSYTPTEDMLQMKVKADGNSFTFYADDTQIGTLTDNTHSSGTVGLYTFTTTGDFDNLTATLINPPTPTATPTPTCTPSPTPGLPYSENFNDSSADDWVVKTGNWSVSNYRYIQSSTIDRRIAYYDNGSSSWIDYEYSADVKVASSGISGIAFRMNETADSYYVIRQVNDTDASFGKVIDGVWTPLNSFSSSQTADNMVELKVIASGNNFTFYADNTLLGSASDSDLTSGTVGLYTFACEGEFDNISVSELTTPTPSPTLTPTPTATPTPAGTLPYSEDFTDGVADNWTVDSGTWSVGSGVYSQSTTTGRQTAYYTNSNNWSDYEYSADVKVGTDINAGIAFRVTNNMEDCYVLRHCSNTAVGFAKIVNDGWTLLESYSHSGTEGSYVTLKVKADGSNLTFYADSTELGSITDTAHSSGSVGLYTFASSGDFDNISVSELATPTPTPTASPTPTPLLDEDFNDDSADNWTVKSGSWSASSGIYSQSSTSERRGVYYSNGTGWTDYEYSADVKAQSDMAAGIAFRVTDSMSDYYVLRLVDNGAISVGKVVDDNWTLLENYEYSGATVGSYVTLKVIADGSSFTFYADDTEIGSVTDTTHSSGTVGLYTFASDDDFDNVLVRP